MGLFRRSQSMMQRYGDFLIPPNKITNIFQLFSSQQNRHIAKLCEHPAFARNYLYNLFFVQSGQMGRREEAHHVTMLQCYMLHVTIPPTPSTSINSPQPPCNPLPLSILQPKSHARRKPARRLSSARVFTFVNKKTSFPHPLLRSKKQGKARWVHTKTRILRDRRLHRRGQKQGRGSRYRPKSGR